MKVNVKRLPADGEELAGEEPPEIIDLDEPDMHFGRPVGYELLAQLQNNALLVTGRLRTVATLRCGRCLREFDQPLEVASFVFHQELTGQDFVDLTPQIREDMILELPQRALCGETCKGLCPVCGVDLNQRTCRCAVRHGDHRWAALNQLKLKD
ncbi:DUF177 domain-containing protein [bacterium]|nr:DUF177 domain-containing protein [bacterium]